VTKKGDALVHTQVREVPVERDTAHDQSKERLLPGDHPVLIALGISTSEGRVKQSRQAKYRQVEEFLRALGPDVTEAIAKGVLRTPTEADPLRIVDLGCGNAYLTFAAHAYLSTVLGLEVVLTGVDSKKQSLDHNSEIAQHLQVADQVSFVRSDIAGYRPDRTPEVVLALHACDTATDDALARGIEWGSPLVLAAPCCHHDVSAQLRQAPVPEPFAALTRDGILRERFADTLTDALRAAVLRAVGYRVDVVEFVESKHTPRNTLLKAVRITEPKQATVGRSRAELDQLSATWHVRPMLVELLGDRLA
jgi:SAM-dependent methyltransferase